MIDLILGTATLNTGYGVANQNKVVTKDEAREIILTAQSLGINEFDTAPGYGPAEEYLGEFLNLNLRPKISSKISKESTQSARLMLQSVQRTLLQTRTSKLKNLYLHDPEVLFGLGASEAIAGLIELKALDLVERIGISVYSLDSLLRAKELLPELSVFQVPENICDRRLLNSKELLDFNRAGDHFIVRSVFLQGLLLMPLDRIPSGLAASVGAISQLINLSGSIGVTPHNLCLGYARAIPWANGLVIGAATASQLCEIVESRTQLPTGWDSVIDTLPEEILDPRRWPE
jgi:aryl-alcohol dehydrogenase-like predicted oxidoreductase